MADPVSWSLRLAQAAARKGIRAWHASPHDFDRFDIRKVGTGQGAQSYGHGIYLAENPKVSGPGGEYWREFSTLPQFTNDGPMHIAMNMLEQHKFDRGAAGAQARKFADDFWRQPFQQKRLQDAAALLESNAAVGPRVYEVNVNARPEQFLSWDAPIETMPGEVVRSVAELGRRVDRPFLHPSMTGKDIYRDLELSLPGIEKMGGTFIDRAAPSKAMLEAGIPGIRYLDQGSRALVPNWQRHANRQTGHEPDKTHNYVVFDDSLIDILRKYAIPGAVGAGGFGSWAPAEDQ